MALETLKGVKQVGGFGIGRSSFKMFNDKTFIEVDDVNNSIVMKIQNGAIKENGINGCQIDTVIETAKIIIEELNNKFPCRENSMAITKLDECLMWLDKRKQDRIKRDVEGFSKK
jgi:hypothetical protein